MKKKPLSDREREALRKLREVFPEHEIFPNMRLADVIKADWQLFNFIKGYHLDFTICDHDGHVLAAVELDDSTHDNQKAQDRDAKKDGYLQDAVIKLIRIRELNEILDIPRLIEEYVFPERAEPASLHQILSRREAPYKSAKIYSSGRKSNPASQTKHYLVSGITSLAVVIILGWGISTYITNMSKTALNMSALRQQQVQQDVQRRANELAAQQSFERAAAQRADAEKSRTATQQPVYERRWTKGKSARECAGPGSVMDNAVVRCMNDHYEVVQVTN